jgi:hypothetical protein
MKPRFSLRIALLGLAACLSLGLAAPAVADTAVPDESLHQAHRLLRELDRFLDHHPLLENDLRRNPSLLADRQYLGEKPELQNFLTVNAGVIRALQMEPRHFLHRALLRQANAPLKYSEVSQLDPFLSEQPAIERDLIEDPARIQEPAYLKLHPPLGDFLAQHPLLFRVFPPEPAGQP